MSERVDRCETCRFWEPYEAQKNEWGWDRGDCHRFPPIPVFCEPQQEHIPEGYFTDVFKDKWCGEWKPAQAAGNVITISYLG